VFTFDTKIAGTGTASDCQSHGIFSTIKSQLLDNYTAQVNIKLDVNVVSGFIYHLSSILTV